MLHYSPQGLLHRRPMFPKPPLPPLRFSFFQHETHTHENFPTTGRTSITTIARHFMHSRHTKRALLHSDGENNARREQRGAIRFRNFSRINIMANLERRNRTSNFRRHQPRQCYGSAVS